MVAGKPIIFVFTTAYAPFMGGAELAVQEIARRLRGEFEFIILTARLQRNLPSEECVLEGKIVRFGMGRSIDKLLLPILAFFYTLKFVSKNHGAIFWGIMISYASIAAFFVKPFHPSIPFVVTLQEGNREWERWPSKIWWRIFCQAGLVNYVTAISNFLKDRAREAGYQGPISVVPNGVDEKLLNIIKPAQEQMRPLVVFSSSRLVHKNGIDILLGAAARLKDEFDFKIILAGDGPEQKKLKLLTHHLSLITRVKFLGRVPYERLPELYQQADIFVRPSRSEGLGSAFLEAMAAGLITIGTPVGGIPDFLIDGKTGFLAKPEDSKDLARALQEVFLMSNDERRIMVENARTLIRERFLWNQIAEKMKIIFTKFL